MSKRFDKPLTFSSRKVLLSFVGALFVFSILALVFSSRGASASQGNTQSQDGVWQFIDESSVVAKGERQIVPQVYRTVQADEAALKTLLGKAPFEFTKEARENRVVISLPMPDGSFAKFHLEESPVMEPALAAKYPEIKTYRGQGIDDPSATTRLDFTPKGFHGIILSERGTIYVDPYSQGDTTNYITYFKSDYRNDEKKFTCLVSDDDKGAQVKDLPAGTNVTNGTTLRTYRLALAATGEYTTVQGGTVALALAAMTTSMNRVNAVYEREVAVHMNLVANENLIIYTNSVTDPYTNDDGVAMLTQNQANLTAVIGTANFDIGHVFSTGGGGVAGLGVVCSTTQKARGVTGSPSPNGDGFDIDYVAHEMGHQFNGRHSFNGTISNCGGGNRTASSAMEVGSGTTIMAYAGICGSQNVQPHSDDYFHVKSLEEIAGFIAGNTCDVETATGNTVPTVSAGANVTIPKGTPFTLTASASDVNGDSITYCWEEYDLGTSSPPDTDATGARPIFRSFNPTASPSRTFPKLSDILNNTSTYGESLPSINRTMNFQVTARDNRANGGGINTATMQVTVNASAGPFLVTAPNTAVSWTGGTTQTVTWDVANTTAAPISAANVKISFSSDGGNTFPVVLAVSTPNDGSEAITVPNVATSTGRIKVEAVGNVFFDISNANFTVTPSSAVTGTWTVGLFRPSSNFFFLRNTNTTGSPDISVPFGAAGDIPVVGDWDGDGVMTIGLYRPSSSTFFLRNSNTVGFPDITVPFGDGPNGDIPIVGDWNGDGTWTIGVYRPSTSTFFLRNSNTVGGPDISVPYGAAGDQPVVGDWDGNGTMTVGLYRPTGSIFFLRNTNSTGSPDITVPYGATGDQPVVGDWDGNGTMTVGLYRPTGSIFFLRNTNTTGSPDITVPYGATGDTPVVGDWDGL